jgi:hypothetical protein
MEPPPKEEAKKGKNAPLRKFVPPQEAQRASIRGKEEEHRTTP